MANNRDELVKLVLEGENLLTDDLNEAIDQLDKLSKEAKESKADLKELEKNQGLIDSFKRLGASVEQTKEELIQARVKVAETGAALKEAGDNADKDLRVGFERAKVEVSELNKQLTKNNSALSSTEKAIKKAGLSTKDLDQEQSRLAAQITETNKKLNGLNASYETAQKQSREQVQNLQKETQTRRENLNELKVEDAARKATVDGIERQEAALRLVANELEKETASRKTIETALNKESASRKKVIANIDAEVNKIEEETKARQKTEAALKQYATEYDKLVRTRERGEVSLKQMIAAEQELINKLELTESAIKKTRTETAAIAKEEEKLRIESENTAKALKEKEQAAEKTATAITEYRNEIEKLIRKHKEEEISLRELNQREKELIDQLGVSSSEYRSIRREIDQVVTEEVKLAKAAKKTADAIESERKEAERIDDALKKYRQELDKLNAEKRQGTVTNGQYIESEEKIRKQLNLTAGNVATARRSIEADSKGKAEASKSTDLLTQSTRRLAQAYTVLIAAQTAVQGVVGTIREFGNLEQSITGVEKTTNSARLEMIELAEELENMSEFISGTATNDLLKYAETAGQMGIKGADALKEMTIAADALGVSTDLAGDKAIAALQRINKITGESEQGIKGVASAAVALGNEFAASESEIVDFAVDLASGTTNANLASKAVFGLAAALKEIGLPQERTRSTFARTFQVIESAVKKGGDAMVELQKVTGQTADELQKNFGTNSEKIFLDFLKGLDSIEQKGGSVTDVMRGFGVTSIETVQTLSTMTGQIDNISRALDVSNKAFDEGNAHLKEAAKFWANQNSEIDRATAALTAFKARIGETLTDETQIALDGFTAAFKQNEEAITEAANALVDLGLGAAEGVASVSNLLGAISDVTGEFSLMDLAITNISSAFNGLEILIDTMATGLGVLNLEIQTFFGASDEQIAKLENRVEKSTASMAKNIREFENAQKIAAGEMSAAYADLDESIRKYADGVNALSKDEKAAIDLIIQKTGYQEGQDKLYNQLTASILRNHREQKVLTYQTSEHGTEVSALNSFLAENGVVLEKSTEATKAKTTAVVDQTEALKQNKEVQENSWVVLQEVIAASKEAATGQGEYQIALESINKEIVAQETNLRIAIQTGQGYAKIQESLTKLYKEQAEAQTELTARKEIDNQTSETIINTAQKYAQKLADLNNQYDSGTLKVGEYEAAKAKIEAVLNRITPLLSEEQKAQVALFESLNNLTRAEKESSLARELSSVTMANAANKAAEYKKRLDELERQFKSNSISLTEYTSKKQLLETVLRQIIPLLNEEQKAMLGLSSAIDGAGVSTTAFVQQQQTAAESVKVTADNIRDLQVAHGSLRDVARETGNDLLDVGKAAIEESRQIKGATTAVNLMAGAAAHLTKQFNFTSTSSEGLKNRIRELNDMIYQNQKVSNLWWKSLAQASNEAFKREKRIINETLALRKYGEQLESNNLTLRDVERIAKDVKYNIRELDASQLSGLKSQIESARRSFLALGDAAEDAADSVQDRYDELLGNSADIIKRRFETELDTLKELYKQAGDAGNKEAQRDLKNAMQQLRVIRDAELKGIKEEQAEIEKQKRQEIEREKREPIQRVRDTYSKEYEPRTQQQQQPIGQPQEMRYIIEIRMSGLNTEIELQNQGDVNALLNVFESMGQVSNQGDN